jgi:hypothetical protein
MAISTVVDGCVNVLTSQKKHITENKESFIYKGLRVSDRIVKKITSQFVTARTRVVDGCVKVLGLCLQINIFNNK